MSTPKPETDAQKRTISQIMHPMEQCTHWVPADLASKLEQERDELKQLLSETCSSFTEQIRAIHFAADARIAELNADLWMAKAVLSQRTNHD